MPLSDAFARTATGSFVRRHCGTVLLAWLVVAGAPAHAAQVWFEYGLGFVTVGFDKAANAYTHRKFYLAAFEPDYAQLPADVQPQPCLETATSEAAETLRKALLAIAEPPEEEAVTPAQAASVPKAALTPAQAASAAKAEEERLAQRDAQVDQLVFAAVATFRSKLRSLPQCAGMGTAIGLFHPGLVQRICDAKAQCKNVELAYAKAAPARSFHALRTWLNLRDNLKLGVVPVNAPVVLLDAPDVPSSLRLLEQDEVKKALAACTKALQQASPDARKPICVGLMLADQLKDANLWPAAPDPTNQQQQLEQLVVQARAAQSRLHRDVVQLVDAPYEVAVRVLDSLDQPLEVLDTLRKDPKANLLSIQDELARTRIAECVRFQGVSQPALVSRCAGFVVDVKTVGLCLAGQECRPPLSADGMASAAALTLLKPIAFKDLAQANLLPRIGVDPAKFQQVFDACARDQPTREAASKCVLDKQLTEQQKKAMQCLQTPAPGQTLAERVSCATGEQLPVDVKQAVECLQGAEAAQRINCVAKSQMPREMRIYAECREEVGNDDVKLAACAARKMGKVSVPPEMQAYAECKESAGNDNKKLALCMAQKLGKPALPPAVSQCLEASRDKGWEAGAMCVASQQSKEAAQVFDCAQKAGGDQNKFLGCMALKNIPPKHQQAATCLAQSGSATGAALCMAAGSSKLNEDQRIVAECLATSPDGLGTLGCIGGRMALQTFFKCVDKKIFEGNCFGKNNEIVKAFAALGVRLHPGSGIGRVLNAAWDVVKFQVATTKAIAKGVEHFSREAKEELAKAERSVRNTRKKIGREAGRIGNQTEANASGAVRAAKEGLRKLGLR